jgi:glutaredoxin
METIKLIYFNGCPNFKSAKNLLEEVGLKYELICLDELSDSDTFKNYSSPTYLLGNKIFFGTKACGGGCSLHLPSKEELLKLIAESTL